MSDLPEPRPAETPTQSQPWSYWLVVLAVVGIIGAALWLVVRIWELPQASAQVPAFLSAVGLFLVALMPSVLVLGLAKLVSRVETIVRNDAAVIANTAAAVTTRPALQGNNTIPSHTLDEMVVLLREVRDISLLNDSQRTKRLEAQSRAAVEVLLREVPVLLREHNWIEARNRVQEARERFPNIPDWDAMERQIEQMRSQVEQHDLEAAERQIADLTTLGAWDRVADVVRELLQRHPGSVKAIELAQRVRATRNKVEVEQRGRLMAQAQDATNKRDWRAAYSLALQMIERYPKSPDAQALRLQLPTLRENAEIQTRQKLESEIRELVRNHRYPDAIRIAGDVIQQYPNSPQADALREQLPKLQERALAGVKR